MHLALTTRTGSLRAAAGRIVALFVTLTLPVMAQAVPGDVTGVVADSTGAPLPGATVVLLHPADFALAGFAQAERDGAFRVRAVAPGPYLVRASFVGFAPRERAIEVGTDGLDVGALRLAAAVDRLGALVVTAERVPLVIRRDTLDYDAGAVRVAPGATVEDLLRQLPGVEVDPDGTVRAQGERVQRVLVDGKEFFGDDPTVATRNLPADAVDRVQVYDKASDTAEFTGVDDGRDQRTINLALKEDRRAGAFGVVEGGLGGATAEATGAGGGARYDGRVSANRFRPSTQLSVLANVNNVNRQSLSLDDYLQFMGGVGALAAGGGTIRLDTGGVPVGGDASDGIATTLSGGVHVGHEVGPHSSVRASYLGHWLSTDRARQTLRQEVVAGADASRVVQDAGQTDRRSGHRLDVTAEHEIAEGHDVRLRSSLRASGTGLDATAQRATSTGGTLASAAATTSRADGLDLRGDAGLTYRRRLGGGLSVVAQASGNVGSSEEDGRLDADVQWFRADRPLARERGTRQETDHIARSSGSAEVLLTQSVADGRALQLTAEHGVTRDDQDRTVLDSRSASDPGHDGTVRSRFERRLAQTRVGLTATASTGALRASAGLGVERSQLDGRQDETAPPTTDRTTVRVLPSAVLRWEPATGRNLEVRYEASTRVPALREISPVAEALDPFEVRLGNPALRPEAVHALSGRYIHVDAFTATTAAAFARASYTAGAVTASRSVDALLRQRTEPVNGDGAWSVVANGSLSTPLRPLRSTVSVRANGVYDRRETFVNGAPNGATLVRGDLDVRVHNRNRDLVDVQVGARVGYHAGAYALGPSRRYTDRTVYTELGWTPSAAWSVRSVLDVTWYADGGLEGRRAVPLWDLAVSRAFMGGRTRVEVSATDLLDRTVGVDYTATPAYVEEARVETLGRRVLLRLSYNLSGAGRRTGAASTAR